MISALDLAGFPEMAKEKYHRTSQAEIKGFPVTELGFDPDKYEGIKTVLVSDVHQIFFNSDMFSIINMYLVNREDTENRLVIERCPYAVEIVLYR